MADLNDLTANVNIWDDAKSKAVSVITEGSNERLAVDAYVSDSDNDFGVYRGKYVNQHLENAGSRDMNVNGSVTPVSFTAGPGSGKRWYIARLLVTLEDSSINHTKFGGQAALTNGIDFKVTESGTERDVIPHRIKKNGQWRHFSYDSAIESASTDIMTIRWTFANGLTAFKLNNADSDNLKIIVNDDLTSISTFVAVIQGFEVDE